MKAPNYRLTNLAQDKLTGELLICCGLNCDKHGKNSNITFAVLDRLKFPLPDGWKAEPIPLTEEWLLKFGFEKQEKHHSHRTEFKKGKFSLMLIDWIDEDDCDFTLFKTPNGELTYYAHGEVPKANHVHTLQNLYFALTGEELKTTLIKS